MKTIPVKTWYLEILSHPEDEVAAPLPGMRVDRAWSPAIDYYRTLYRAVGEAWNWVDRQLMSDEALQAIIQDPLVEIYIFRIAGEPIGYGELDRRNPDETELAYFGLFPRFHGKGLSRYFLSWLIRRAWSQGPKRLWVHTCEQDHPAARPLYEKFGFKLYDEQIIDQRVE